jgi:hypothetical protein
MSAERQTLGGLFPDDRPSVRAIDLTDEAQVPSKSSCDAAPRPFLPTTFIPAGPATALAMPPTVHRRVVS